MLKPKKSELTAGQPEHVWDATIAARIVECCSSGWTRKAISLDVGLSIPTILKHYRAELDEGDEEANGAVKNALFTAATSDKSVPAMIFWLKARCNWSERAVLDVNQNMTGSVVVVELPANGREAIEPAKD
jgi:hypothetical protein